MMCAEALTSVHRLLIKYYHWLVERNVGRAQYRAQMGKYGSLQRDFRALRR